MRTAIIIATAVASLLSALGCMSFTFGGRTEVASPPQVSDAVSAMEWQQLGNVRIPVGEEMTVYYPIPYASPPNLVITDKGGTCRVIEQKADCFRIKNNADTPFVVAWTARGVKAPPPATPVVAPASMPALASPVTH